MTATLDAPRTETRATAPARVARGRTCRSATPRRWRRWRRGSRRLPQGDARRAGLAGRASAALHRRHQRRRGRPSRRRPLPGLPDRPRRPVHLSRPRPAGGLCHARPQPARSRPPQICRGLEEWIIRTLAAFGVAGERRDGLVGVWVATPAGYDKIAAIGIRVRRWVSFHGIALNVDPDLEHFSGIVPCGVRGARRHQPPGARRRRDDAGGRRRAPPRVRGAVRPDRSRRRQHLESVCERTVVRL